MMDKELKRQLLTAMNVAGATMTFISAFALADGNAAEILGKILKAFKMEAFYALTFPYCLICIFALGILVLSFNFIGSFDMNSFFNSDDIVSDNDVKNGTVCKLKGYAWDSNDFSRGWLITGKTGSGKTAGAIMHLMRQVFLRCSGEYKGIPKWGGVAVDQKGDFWEIVEGFARTFGRQRDLIMLKTRRNENDAPPIYRFNLVSYKGITRSTYAQLVIDCSKSVAGGKNDGEAFWDNSARNAIESSFHLTDAMECFLRPSNDGLNDDRIRAINAAANKLSGQHQAEHSASIDTSISGKISRPLNEYAQVYREFDKHKYEAGIYPKYEELKANCASHEGKLAKLCVKIDINRARKAVIEGTMPAYISELAGATSNPENGRILILVPPTDF